VFDRRNVVFVNSEPEYFEYSPVDVTHIPDWTKIARDEARELRI
jgi:hypothetical protein